MNEHNGVARFRCGVCSNLIPIEHLVVDSFFLKIIEQIRLGFKTSAPGAVSTLQVSESSFSLLEKEVTCPLTQTVMKKPICCSECQYSFDESPHFMGLLHSHVSQNRVYRCGRCHHSITMKDVMKDHITEGKLLLYKYLKEHPDLIKVSDDTSSSSSSSNVDELVELEDWEVEIEPNSDWSVVDVVTKPNSPNKSSVARKEKLIKQNSIDIDEIEVLPSSSSSSSSSSSAPVAPQAPIPPANNVVDLTLSDSEDDAPLNKRARTSIVDEDDEDDEPLYGNRFWRDVEDDAICDSEDDAGDY